MKPIRQFLVAAALAVAFAGAVHAQAPAAVAPPAKLKGADLAHGEVRKIDKARRTITLKHGEIKNLGMPPMAMQYEVRDPAMIAKLKEGDKVRFNASFDGGKYFLTEIQPAK